MSNGLNKELKVFVYGTLMSGFYNNNKYLSGKVESIEKAWINGKLYQQFMESYPSLLKGEDKVYGELITLKNFEEDIKALDKLEEFLGEGNPKNLYHREVILANLEDNSKEEAYVYFFNVKDEKDFEESTMYIPHGDWRRYVAETR